MGLKEFSREELSRFDGKEGRPAYIAYKGKVYDVSESAIWDEGDHLGMHEAGKDLTEDMEDSPHEEDNIFEMPLVGELEG